MTGGKEGNSLIVVMMESPINLLFKLCSVLSSVGLVMRQEADISCNGSSDDTEDDNDDGDDDIR